METYLLIGPDGESLGGHDTWQEAAEAMAEWDAEDQKLMYIVFERDD